MTWLDHIGVIVLLSCFQHAAIGFLSPRPVGSLSPRTFSSLTTKTTTTGITALRASNTNFTQPNPPKRGRINTNVRNIMERIESNYDSSEKNEDWTKTKTYVYHASANLSLQQVQEVIGFLDSIVSKEVSKQILQTTPRILRKPVQSFLKPTADFLLQLWGPSLFEEAMRRNPQLLLTSGVGYTTNRRTAAATANSTTTQDHGDGIEEVLNQQAGISGKSLARLKRTAPFVFGLPLDKVTSVLEYLSNLLRRGTIAQKQIPTVVRKLVTNHPFLLNLSVEKNLQPRIEFLSNNCGLNDTDVAKIVQSAGGSVLGLSVEENLKPTMDFLTTLLQNDRTALRKCILSHPQLLALSIANLQSKADYFDSIGAPLAARIALRCPAVYSLSLVENIVPTIDFLAKVWGLQPPPHVSNEDITDGTFSSAAAEEATHQNLNNEGLSQLLQEYPNILTLSLVGNLQTTMNFFNRTGYTLLDDDWSLVEGHARIRGRYIAASLYHRLLPRWHYCLTNDWTAPPLHLLVGASDVRFSLELGVELSEFVRFKEEATPRLKFSSQFDTWLKTGRPIDV